MNTYPDPVNAREGRRFRTTTLVVCVVATCFSLGWSVVFWFIEACMRSLLCNRKGELRTPANAVLSPAGRHLVLEDLLGFYASHKNRKICVGTDMSNARQNRLLLDGSIKTLRYLQNGLANARPHEASVQYEGSAAARTAVNGQMMSLVQVAGPTAGPILCRVKAAAQLRRGRRCGLTRRGSRVGDLIQGVAPRASMCDKVGASQNTLAGFWAQLVGFHVQE